MWRFPAIITFSESSLSAFSYHGCPNHQILIFVMRLSRNRRLTGVLVFFFCGYAWVSASVAGALDEPDPRAVVDKSSETQSERPAPLSQATPDTDSQAAPVDSIVEQVRLEQARLEQLPRAELEARARRGERAAQAVLGAYFAREASLLGFSNEATSAAIADALTWYNLAAATGFPGAPSLDRSGIRLYPIRAPR